VIGPIYNRNLLIAETDLKMEATLSSEIVVSTYKTTWGHNPEDRKRHIYSRGNLKSQSMSHLPAI
jgi:hypothetical protein